MAHKSYDDEMDEEVTEQTSDAKRKIKIDQFKKQGFSERDAVIKGSKFGQSPNSPKLVSMKKDKTENKPMEVPASPGDSSEEYPYGLRIRLENDELEKLGFKDLPEIGKSLKVTAEAAVQSISSNESVGSKGNKKCVELQITSMQLDKAKASKKDSGSGSDSDDIPEVGY